MKKLIEIVMADDHPIVRQGLRQIIETDPGISVVGEADNGETALELIEEHRPDVAVLDIDMPGKDGFEVVRELGTDHTGFVFLTMHDEPDVFEEAMGLGVRGYVLKDSAVTDIVNAIRSVAEGKPFLSPSLSALLLERRRRAEDLEESRPGLRSLTPTERKILRLIADDKTSREIGAKLYISHRTVETHRANICRKLELRGSLALVRFAAAHRSEL